MHIRPAALVGSLLMLVASSAAVRADVAVARLEPRCPTNPSLASIAGQEAFLATVAELFLGSFIDAAVGAIGNALTEAARKDREGITLAAPIDPAWVYTIVAQPGAAADGSSKFQLHANRCVVVGVFATEEADAASCVDALANSGTVDENAARLAICGWAAENGHQVAPKFYAEVWLKTEGASKLAQPKPQRVVYREPLADRRGTRRSLNLTVIMRAPSPEGRGGAAIGTYIGSLSDVVPASLAAGRRNATPPKPLSNAALKPATGWFILPERPTSITAKGFGGPIDLEVAVNETGQTNPFLQFFAAAFEENKAKIAEAAKAELLPSKRAEADKQAAIAALEAEVSLKQAEARAEEFWIAWKRADRTPVAAETPGFESDADKLVTVRKARGLFEVNAAQANKTRVQLGMPTIDYDAHFRAIYST